MQLRTPGQWRALPLRRILPSYVRRRPRTVIALFCSSVAILPYKRFAHYVSVDVAEIVDGIHADTGSAVDQHCAVLPVGIDESTGTIYAAEHVPAHDLAGVVYAKSAGPKSPRKVQADVRSAVEQKSVQLIGAI